MRRIWDDAIGKHVTRKPHHGALQLLANLAEIGAWAWLFERAR
jgi:hypothetical protein